MTERLPMQTVRSLEPRHADGAYVRSRSIHEDVPVNRLLPYVPSGGTTPVVSTIRR